MIDLQPTGLVDFTPTVNAEGELVSDEEAQPENFVLPQIAAKFAMPSDIGDPIDEEVAQSATYLMTHQLELKVLDEVTAKYPAPSNCEILDTPKVNPHIRDHLPTARHQKP